MMDLILSDLSAGFKWGEYTTFRILFPGTAFHKKFKRCGQ